MSEVTAKRQRAILKPIITYKSSELSKLKCYCFRVRPSANKTEIAQEFEELFQGSKVLRVNTVAIRSHSRRTKKGRVPKADGKKAFIYTNIELDIFPRN